MAAAILKRVIFLCETRYWNREDILSHRAQWPPQNVTFQLFSPANKHRDYFNVCANIKGGVIKRVLDQLYLIKVLMDQG